MMCMYLGVRSPTAAGAHDNGNDERDADVRSVSSDDAAIESSSASVPGVCVCVCVL
jgi:hypothetical protein